MALQFAQVILFTSILIKAHQYLILCTAIPTLLLLLFTGCISDQSEEFPAELDNLIADTARTGIVR